MFQQVYRNCVAGLYSHLADAPFTRRPLALTLEDDVILLCYDGKHHLKQWLTTMTL